MQRSLCKPQQKSISQLTLNLFVLLLLGFGLLLNLWDFVKLFIFTIVDGKIVLMNDIDDYN